MISIITRYKRGLTITGILLFSLFTGMIMMSIDLEITGFLFLFSAGCLLIYLLALWFFRRKKFLSYYSSWLKKEVWVTSISMSLLSLVGAMESFTNYPELTLFYSALCLFTGRIVYKIAQNSNRKFPLWLIGLSIGIIFLALNDLFDEEFFVIFFFIYVSVFFVLIARWVFRQISIIVQLKNEKAKTELLHLKSQVNPHFFFNMLNNLYGLVNKDSKKAQELILKLSDMMRYSIYEGQKDVVTLEEEIAYLKNYIELHQMRYHKKIDITFDCDIQREGCKVMPLLFIILLENAFKHGVENLRKNAYVYLDMTTMENEIQFTIENNFEEPEQNQPIGIGLKNLKRRLELVYPNQHSLFFSETEHIYKVQLTLQAL